MNRIKEGIPGEDRRRGKYVFFLEKEGFQKR